MKQERHLEKKGFMIDPKDRDKFRIYYLFQTLLLESLKFNSVKLFYHYVHFSNSGKAMLNISLG